MDDMLTSRLSGFIVHVGTEKPCRCSFFVPRSSSLLVPFSSWERSINWAAASCPVVFLTCIEWVYSKMAVVNSFFNDRRLPVMTWESQL